MQEDISDKEWGHTVKVVQSGTQKEMETRTCMATRGCSWEDCRTNEREVSLMGSTVMITLIMEHIPRCTLAQYVSFIFFFVVL